MNEWKPVEDGLAHEERDRRIYARGKEVEINNWEHRIFIKLPDDIRLCRRVPDNRPRPDWSSAPDWATWWAVDSNGYAAWYDREPERETYQHHWKYGDRQSANAGMVEIPLGVDWRLLCESRPEES